MKPADPAYIALLKSGALALRAKTARKLLKACTLCPRRCAVDRLNEALGICRTGRQAVVASYDAHFGEEAPLVGRHGSGTIFFSHCNLGCIFCQNYDISHRGAGRSVSAQELAEMMLALQHSGCHNINFVTPSHVVPQILAALQIAADNGLHIPLVYNTSGYDRVRTLRLLEGVIDIYMPDFKFWDSRAAEQTAGASDYPVCTRRAIREMHRQVGDLVIDDGGIARRGLLIRHLVMPAGLAGTEQVMAFIASEISSDTYVNVMGQYRPCGRAAEMKALATTLDVAALRQAVAAAKGAGLHRLDRPRRIFALEC